MENKDDSENITLVVRNVTPLGRYILKRICQRLDCDGGDYLSQLFEKEGKKELGAHGVQAVKDQFSMLNEFSKKKKMKKDNDIQSMEHE